MLHPAGLRILLANDLSPSADAAAALVRDAAWPPGTVVRVVTSPAGIGPPLSSFATLTEVRAHSAEVRGMIEHAHERLAVELRDAGLVVETRVVHGKPERAIVTAADRFGADLIVVGARGQGPLSATLLGSVSRAVVEHEARSVLVVRGTSLERVVLATDDSGPAGAATDLVATWPAFRAARILVVGVGESAPRYPRSVLDGAEWRAAFRDTIADSTEHAFDAVERAVSRLERAGREVDVEVRLGDLATEVVSAAQGWPADVVVLGAADRSFLARLFGESLPRRILDGVAASVLVVRRPD